MSYYVIILGLCALCVNSAPTKKDVREILAAIYSDHPGLEADISEDELKKVLSMTIEQQLESLKEVLKESDLDLGDLENYLMQDTSLTQNNEENGTRITNTTIIGLPDAAVVQQIQQSYDADGQPIKGSSSAIEIQVSQDDSSNEDHRKTESVLDDGAESDKLASVDPKVGKVEESDTQKIHSDKIVDGDVIHNLMRRSSGKKSLSEDVTEKDLLASVKHKVGKVKESEVPKLHSDAIVDINEIHNFEKKSSEKVLIRQKREV